MDQGKSVKTRLCTVEKKVSQFYSPSPRYFYISSNLQLLFVKFENEVMLVQDQYHSLLTAATNCIKAAYCKATHQK